MICGAGGTSYTLLKLNPHTVVRESKLGRAQTKFAGGWPDYPSFQRRETHHPQNAHFDVHMKPPSVPLHLSLVRRTAPNSEQSDF